MENDLCVIYYGDNTNDRQNETKTGPRIFWMIAGNGNSPKVRHENYESAVKETTRLAEFNPGIEFYIMEAVECIHKPTATIRHKLV